MSPYEEFARVFSKFASAEEVTGPRVDPDAEAEADEDKEGEAAEVRRNHNDSGLCQQAMWWLLCPALPVDRIVVSLARCQSL